MILAVAGSAGGVGRSTLTLELAAALDGIAVDADLGMADLPQGRGPDLHDVLAGRAAPIEAVQTGPTRTEGGESHDPPVGILPCGRSLAGARAADRSRLTDAIRRATRGHDAVIDCPTDHPGAALAAADLAVLVTTPARWTETRADRRLVADHDTAVAAWVWNAGSEPPPAVERRLSAPVVAVPSDDRLARTIHTGRPAVQDAPESGAGEAIRSLAAVLERCRPTHVGAHESS